MSHFRDPYNTIINSRKRAQRAPFTVALFSRLFFVRSTTAVCRNAIEYPTLLLVAHETYRRTITRGERENSIVDEKKNGNGDARLEFFDRRHRSVLLRFNYGAHFLASDPRTRNYLISRGETRESNKYRIPKARYYV